jgi:hypothetical protein
MPDYGLDDVTGETPETTISSDSAGVMRQSVRNDDSMLNPDAATSRHADKSSYQNEIEGGDGAMSGAGAVESEVVRIERPGIGELDELMGKDETDKPEAPDFDPRQLTTGG